MSSVDLSPPARRYESWGRNVPCRARALGLSGTRDPLPASPRGVLAVGLGRSYGDVGLNDGGVHLETRFLDRILAWDAAAGVIRAEAGLSLDALLAFSVPRGWFVPVTPGTRYVTLGGAVANDVHGKNHHRAGTFGCHVRSLGLRRGDGEELRCSPQEHAELFAATIGGMGLTGLVTWVEVALERVATGWIRATARPLASLEEAFACFAGKEGEQAFTVAWLDGLRPGRGVFLGGDWSQEAPPGKPALMPPPRPRLSVPVEAPSFLLNNPGIALFNLAYGTRQRLQPASFLQDYTAFFHPLDGVGGWNRLYGRRGFFQYQFVVPHAAGLAVSTEVLRRAKAAGEPPWLVVLKEFGDVPSPGLMSFPMPGTTLAMDFADRGESTRALFRVLDAIVREAGGRLYAAKDACQSPADFRRGYPALGRFARLVDPAFSSSFWRRVGEVPAVPSLGPSLAASLRR